MWLGMAQCGWMYVPLCHECTWIDQSLSCFEWHDFRHAMYCCIHCRFCCISLQRGGALEFYASASSLIATVSGCTFTRNAALQVKTLSTHMHMHSHQPAVSTDMGRSQVVLCTQAHSSSHLCTQSQAPYSRITQPGRRQPWMASLRSAYCCMQVK